MEDAALGSHIYAFVHTVVAAYKARRDEGKTRVRSHTNTNVSLDSTKLSMRAVRCILSLFWAAHNTLRAHTGEETAATLYYFYLRYRHTTEKIKYIRPRRSKLLCDLEPV